MKILSILKEETILETVLLVGENSMRKKMRKPSKNSKRYSERHKKQSEWV